MVSIISGKLPKWISGSGYGYGDGSGYGSGYGYGDGYGDGFYWLKCLKYFMGKWSAEQKARLLQLKKKRTKIAFWRSDEKGLPSNGGGRIEPAAPGIIHKAEGPLNLCNSGTLHATAIPPKWQGERIWVVALHGEVIGDEEKYGCLEREIIGECL